MSILEESGEQASVIEGQRALDLFTDRERQTRHFLSYLHEAPGRNTILFFRGDGGNGKSILLRYLRTKYCRRLPSTQWEWLKKTAATDADFIAAYDTEEVSSAIPVAYIDFAAQPQGDDRPQEAFSALNTLRRQLGQHKFKFPVYDFAVIWYLHKTNKLTDERLHNIFPPEEMDFIMELVGLVLKLLKVQELVLTPTNAFLKLLGKHLDEDFTLFLKRRKLNKWQIENIVAMDPESELVKELPRLLAADVNASLGLPQVPQRIAVFFDAHEALWSSSRDLVGTLYYQRDEWLRLLLASLELREGIVAVVAGRDRPRWNDEGVKYRIRERYIDDQLVGYFGEIEARTYLQKAEVTNTLHPTILSYSKVHDDGFHPLLLGLCADLVLAANRRGTPITPETFATAPELNSKTSHLIHILLSYVDNETELAVKALSACRAFDYEIFVTLGQTLSFSTTRAFYKQLTNFSFVHLLGDQQPQRFRIHELLQRILRERNDTDIRNADAALEALYLVLGSSGELSAIAERIYHANQRDWVRGIQEWVSVFQEALSSLDPAACRLLLDTSRDLTIKDDFFRGRVALAQGDYFHQLLDSSEALQAYTEAESIYEHVLTMTPENSSAHINKANSLRLQGDILAASGEREKAQALYFQALDEYHVALDLQSDASALMNLGTAYISLGKLEHASGNLGEAERKYRQALQAYDQAAAADPEYAVVSVNKGLALNDLDMVQIGLI